MQVNIVKNIFSFQNFCLSSVFFIYMYSLFCYYIFGFSFIYLFILFYIAFLHCFQNSIDFA